MMEVERQFWIPLCCFPVFWPVTGFCLEGESPTFAGEQRNGFGVIWNLSRKARLADAVDT